VLCPGSTYPRCSGLEGRFQFRQEPRYAPLELTDASQSHSVNELEHLVQGGHRNSCLTILPFSGEREGAQRPTRSSAATAG
jgi:hypothetical protein